MLHEQCSHTLRPGGRRTPRAVQFRLFGKCRIPCLQRDTHPTLHAMTTPMQCACVWDSARTQTSTRCVSQTSLSARQAATLRKRGACEHVCFHRLRRTGVAQSCLGFKPFSQPCTLGAHSRMAETRRSLKKAWGLGPTWRKKARATRAATKMARRMLPWMSRRSVLVCGGEPPSRPKPMTEQTLARDEDPPNASVVIGLGRMHILGCCAEHLWFARVGRLTPEQRFGPMVCSCARDVRLKRRAGEPPPTKGALPGRSWVAHAFAWPGPVT